MRGKIVSFAFIFIFAFLPICNFGQDLLIKNGTILTITKGTMPKTDILILGGIIKKIDKNIDAPKYVKIIDATGKYVMPGIIDAHTHIAITEYIPNELEDPNTAEVNIRDVLNAEDPLIYEAVAGGVTMVHTMLGSHNPITGQNAVLKLRWGRSVEEMICPNAYKTLKFALGENPKRPNYFIPTSRYPHSRMGVIALIRREFLKAKNYIEQWDRYLKAKNIEKSSGNIIPPKKDLRMEALANMLRGKILARCHTYRADETLEFIRLSKELGFKIACFEHVSEAFKIAKELAIEGIPISIFLDVWSFKIESSEGIAYNAAYCTKKGVLVSLNSDGGVIMHNLFNEAAKAMKYGGLSEEESLKLITINPATQLGVDNIVGSLEVGKHGDIAVFKEHPLSIYTRCEMTIIDGEIYFDRAQYLKAQEEREKNKKEGEDGGDNEK